MRQLTKNQTHDFMIPENIEETAEGGLPSANCSLLFILFGGEGGMIRDDANIVLGALDSLGVALADHHHQWTVGEREIFEQAVEIMASSVDGCMGTDSSASETPCSPSFKSPQITNMKYIVTQQANGTEEIFIFPKAVHHKDMAETVGFLKEHSRDGSGLLQSRSVRRGWRSFLCDECGRKWEWPSRDRFSPSGENCPDCGEWIFPHRSRQDETLEVDDMGNLQVAWNYEQNAEVSRGDGSASQPQEKS